MHREFKVREHDLVSLCRINCTRYFLYLVTLATIAAYVLSHTFYVELVFGSTQEEDYTVEINQILYEDLPNLSNSTASSFGDKNFTLSIEFGPGPYMSTTAYNK